VIPAVPSMITDKIHSPYIRGWQMRHAPFLLLIQ
jgi:hypothetical protein